MGIKIALVLGKFLIVPILLMDSIIAILGQFQIPLPEWASVSPIYRDIFMVIGIIYLTIKLLVMVEGLWSKHMDNEVKKAKVNKTIDDIKKHENE